MIVGAVILVVVLGALGTTFFARSDPGAICPKELPCLLYCYADW